MSDPRASIEARVGNSRAFSEASIKDRVFALATIGGVALALMSPNSAIASEEAERVTAYQQNAIENAVASYGLESRLETAGTPVSKTAPSLVNWRLPALQWPIKPFLKTHEIRGTFGEPRAHYTSLPIATERPAFIMNSLDNTGRIVPTYPRRSHFGIDIPAPDGTPVYAMTNGPVSGVGAGTEKVRVGYIDYIHLANRRVRNGQNVKKGQLLGYIGPESEHVHISMNKGGRYINPLTYRRLAGYRDSKPPVIEGAIALKSDSTPYQPGTGGRVEVFIDAFDENNALETGGSRYRRTGIYSMSYVLQDAESGAIVSKKDIFQFNYLPSEATFKYIHHPLSQRIRPLNRYGQPDIAEFYYRASLQAPWNLSPGRTYNLLVGARDATGNVTQQSFKL